MKNKNTEFQTVTRTREEILHAGETIASITRQRCGKHFCFLHRTNRGWHTPTRRAAQTSILAAL